MHIKQVILKGFMSYKEQNADDHFDKKCNVIVGENGSGKSNFFSAIQFVLSSEYFPLSSATRSSLLHESVGPKPLNGYVEIIFDNSDGRLPITKDVVTLRRAFGPRTDTYFLNKKRIDRLSVMNLFEAAGFSKSNPYYIVKQGKIDEIATQSDECRLKLVEEVAGLSIYKKKRKDSKEKLLREYRLFFGTKPPQTCV